MAIFTPSSDEQKIILKAQVLSQINALFSNVKSGSIRLKDSIFKNQNKNLTPAIMLEALDTDAAMIMDLANALQTLLNSISPNSVDLTPPIAVTRHDDGTVTVTEGQ